jgi:hypothetical protein
MAYEVPGFIIGTLKATADLSALQFTFVMQTTLGGIAGTTINTQRPLGILQNTPTSNQACSIMVSGISKLVSGTTTMVPNDLVGSTAGGRGVTLTTGSSAWYGACVLEAADTTGVMTVQVFPAQRVI